ncbi:BTB/POZ domain-containing protein [Platanthera guangdongensis]|uniref:BTB/POZ domain-containing protein n=1 Tax=Platanthera guangdongensis TaxID=2320717 RepID=A0ABR2LLH5_9ASPA
MSIINPPAFLQAPLVSKSGFFRKALSSSPEIEIPNTFPGGLQAFEMAMLFIYGASLPLDPFNVLALRCAAGFLEMTEDYSAGNLCEQSDLYLNQVVLQSWDDTLVVLQKCRALLSWSEELLVTSRCIESLAFMVCMEILDPEREPECPLLNLRAMAGRPWCCEAVKEIAGQHSWVNEIIALPFDFFDRIIRSLRKQGVKEKHVSPLVVFYANKWVLSKKTHEYWESNGISAHMKVTEILRGLIGLLPPGEKSCRVIPAGFYFAMISRCISLGLNDECMESLEEQASSLLRLARAEDFLLPASGVELKVMERIFSLHEASKNCGYSMMNTESRVAELWDRYLSSIAVNSEIGVERFVELIEKVPMADRETHDHLYAAMSAFLQEHSNLSSEEKAVLCRYLNCQKLSQPVCIQAVQNELMPLRLIVKALSVQQLHTHQAFKDFSESFRYSQFVDFSGSLPSSKSQALLNQYLESPYQLTTEEEDNGGIGLAFKGLPIKKTPVLSKKEDESASFRIQILEEELMTLKTSLKQKGLDRHDSRMRRMRARHVNSCVGSNVWASQMKYVDRLLSKFRRMRMFGKGKNKLRQVSSGVEGSSVDCKSKTLKGDPCLLKKSE